MFNAIWSLYDYYVPPLRPIFISYVDDKPLCPQPDVEKIDLIKPIDDYKPTLRDELDAIFANVESPTEYLAQLKLKKQNKG